MKPDISPQELRQLIRSRTWTTPTSGSASGYLQANLVMLPADEAFNFLLFCVRNPKPCPILDVLEPGQTEPIIAAGAAGYSLAEVFGVKIGGQTDLTHVAQADTALRLGLDHVECGH